MLIIYLHEKRCIGNLILIIAHMFDWSRIEALVITHK
jgi:hypothetical protein